MLEFFCYYAKFGGARTLHAAGVGAKMLSFCVCQLAGRFVHHSLEWQSLS